MNRGEEDYIKVIYELAYRQVGNGLVTNLQLSRFFSHTPQTVNEMIKKLIKKNLVNYIPYKGSLLTEEGKQIAIRMIRVHRIWETFLVDKLGYSWDQVHEEAEILEHITSKKLEESLFSFLGEPTTCPHGNHIPILAENVKNFDTLCLTDATLNAPYRLKRVFDNKDLLIYLNQLDIQIGQLILVENVDPISETITLLTKNKHIVIGFKVANQLFITSAS